MYLIAEIGMNHEGDLLKALELVESTAKAGWNAAKFQTYTADKLAAKHLSPAYWDTTEEAQTSQFELFDNLPKLTMDDYKTIQAKCVELGIDFLTTPFDSDSLRDVGPLIPRVKVASADLTNVPLLRQVAKTGKPILLSVGASNDEEIRTALEILKQAKSGPVTLLHCILNYPTSRENAHLWRIKALRSMFPEYEIGYSDHTKHVEGALSPCAIASTLGASVIEKHVTYNKTLKGNDHYHSADFEDMIEIRVQIEDLQTMIGVPGSDFLKVQESARTNARRRVFAGTELRSGQLLEDGDLIPLRANSGIEVSHWDDVVGRRINRDLLKGQPVEWDVLG